jgi:hypothetical protein
MIPFIKEMQLRRTTELSFGTYVKNELSLEIRIRTRPAQTDRWQRTLPMDLEKLGLGTVIPFSISTFEEDLANEILARWARTTCF